MSLHGTGVSPGIATGRAHIAQHDHLDITERALQADQIEREVRRFRQAVKAAIEELATIRERIPASTPTEILEFIETHALMLNDTTLVDPPVQTIRELKCNAEWALEINRNRLAAIFDEMDDPYLASRMDDIDQVVARIQRKLHGRQGTDESESSYEGIILVADDLAPADLTLLHHNGLVGLITEHGGPLSHTAILAKSLKIPAAMGIKHARLMLKEREKLMIDGGRGIVMANLSRALAKHYAKRQTSDHRQRAKLSKLKDKPAITKCGTRVNLLANIDVPRDLKLLEDAGAEGIGLYRTEYLFLNRNDLPSEEEQFEIYRDLIVDMSGKPVTIRTMDLGSDKQLNQDTGKRQNTLNPALGLRAIRMCLADRRLFQPQLRALARAAVFGPLRILIPMFSNSQEMFQVRNLVRATLRELAAEGVEVPGDIDLGGMIEVPAAAISAQTFAKNLDFLSIGTNDLIQYTLAIDRVDDSVGYLYDPMHPAIISLIQNVITAAGRSKTPVAMCGEMAGDPRYVRLLLALGLREFSMHPGNLLEVKQVVRSTDLEKISNIATRILRASNPLRISGLLRELNEV